MSPIFKEASTTLRAESDEDFADRIWQESYEEARATLQRQIYGGGLVAAPVALISRGFGLGRTGARFGMRVVGAVVTLVELAIAISIVVAVAWVVRWLLPFIPWDVVAVVIPLAVIGLVAHARFSKRRV